MLPTSSLGTRIWVHSPYIWRRERFQIGRCNSGLGASRTSSSASRLLCHPQMFRRLLIVCTHFLHSFLHSLFCTRCEDLLRSETSLVLTGTFITPPPPPTPFFPHMTYIRPGELHRHTLEHGDRKQILLHMQVHSRPSKAFAPGSGSAATPPKYPSGGLASRMSQVTPPPSPPPPFPSEGLHAPLTQHGTRLYGLCLNENPCLVHWAVNGGHSHALHPSSSLLLFSLMLYHFLTSWDGSLLTA